MPYLGRAPAAIGTIANVIEGDLKVKGTISGESINNKFAFDTAADLNDHFLIEDGGTDGSGTNAGDNMLLEDTTQGLAESVELSAITDRSGTSGQLLTSGGALAVPSFTTVTIPDAGWEFVEKVTASDSATIVLGEGNIDVGYDYIILCRSVKPSVDSAFATSPKVQFGTSTGPTYQTSGYVNQRFKAHAAASTVARNDITNGICIMGHDALGGASSGEIWGSEVIIAQPASNSRHECVSLGQGPEQSNGLIISYYSQGHRTTAEVITGLKVLAGTGNFTTGDFILCKRKIA